MSELEKPSKRARTDAAARAATEWVSEFTNRNDLERVLRAIKEIGQPSVTFTVVASQEFCGMRTEAATPSLTSLVRCQITSTVEFADKTGSQERHFTVSCDALLGVLKGSGKPQLLLRLSQRVGLTDLFVESFDTFDQSYSSSTKIQTLVSDMFEPIELDEMSFGWALSMELPFLKGLVKNNRDLGCEAISIEVLSDDTKKTSVVLFECSTTNVTDTKKIVSHIHHKHGEQRNHLSIGEDDEDDGGVCDVDETLLDTKVASVFDLPMFYAFLKSLDQRGKVLVMLQPENPLLVRVNLTDDQSYIYYLQASKMDGEDED